MHKLHILWMYPDLLNLHGERGTLQAFLKAGENLGVEITYERIYDYDSRIPFETADLLLFLPGEIKLIPQLREALNRQRDELEQYIENGGYILAIGTSGLLFGKETVREDGSILPGLGLLDMTAKERQYVVGNDLFFRLRDSKQEVMGSQILMADVEAAHPLGQVIYGYGNNGSKDEGARYKNLLYTNCLGPLMVKNPWWAESMLRDILLRRVGVVGKSPYSYADASFESYLQFVESKYE